jgi:hypothetical protein
MPSPNAETLVRQAEGNHMGNEVELTKYLTELAGRIWVPRAIQEALAVPWVPVFLLGVLGAVLLCRAYWKLYRSTAIPVVRVFILIGYLLVALLLLDVTAALWQVQEASEVIQALRWLLPYESLAFALVALMGIVWVVKGFLPRPGENKTE